MPLLGFDDLYRAADRSAAAVAVVAAGGADRTVLEALRVACDRHWIAPIVSGQESQIRRLADDCGVPLDGFTILDSDEPAHAAVASVRSGQAQCLMKGQIATPDLMRAVLDAGHGLRTVRVICQVPLVEIRSSGRRLLLADTGICIAPTLEQRIDIIASSVKLAQALGAEVPRVALLSATEKVSESMPDTLEAAEITRRNRSGEIGGCLVEGPLSFDLAYAAEAGEKKQIAGSVIGQADVLIFPNLLSANLTIKAIMYTADCRYGGVLCGAACPVVFMSRADDAPTRLNSLALVLRLLSV